MLVSGGMEEGGVGSHAGNRYAHHIPWFFYPVTGRVCVGSIRHTLCTLFGNGIFSDAVFCEVFSRTTTRPTHVGQVFPAINLDVSQNGAGK